MREINIREMRRQLGRLDELLAAEGEVIVVRRGKPVARLIPTESVVRPSHAALREHLRRSAQRKTSVEQDIRADRDER